MLSFEQFEPLVEDAERVKEQTARDPDKTLRQNAEKAFNQIFIAQRHALLAQRKLFEAGMARTYAEQLSAEPGRGRLAERERVRAATLEQQARNHQRASEEMQQAGDQMESEALVMLQRKSQQQLPPQSPPPATTAPAEPQVRHRHRDPPAAPAEGDK